MLDPNSVTITKEVNGNISVSIGGSKSFSLLAGAYLTKMLNSVIVRGLDNVILYEFFFADVLEVISTDGGTVSVTDNDILYNQLNEFFFFEAVGGSVPSGTPGSEVVVSNLVSGDNTISHNLDKTIISFSVKDGNDFVLTEGNIIDTNDFNINLSGGSITGATISFIYI
jgi:hypothetical protein